MGRVADKAAAAIPCEPKDPDIGFEEVTPD
jgi:hypothetical protein